MDTHVPVVGIELSNGARTVSRSPIPSVYSSVSSPGAGKYNLVSTSTTIVSIDGGRCLNALVASMYSVQSAVRQCCVGNGLQLPTRLQYLEHMELSVSSDENNTQRSVRDRRIVRERGHHLLVERLTVRR